MGQRDDCFSSLTLFKNLNLPLDVKLANAKVFSSLPAGLVLVVCLYKISYVDSPTCSRSLFGEGSPSALPRAPFLVQHGSFISFCAPNVAEKMLYGEVPCASLLTAYKKNDSISAH